MKMRVSVRCCTICHQVLMCFTCWFDVFIFPHLKARSNLKIWNVLKWRWLVCAFAAGLRFRLLRNLNKLRGILLEKNINWKQWFHFEGRQFSYIAYFMLMTGQCNSVAVALKTSQGISVAKQDYVYSPSILYSRQIEHWDKQLHR